MKFTVIGFETAIRKDKRTGEDVPFVNLHLSYKTPNVSGYAVRTEFFGGKSAFYPTIMNHINGGSLLGAECNIDSDVITAGDKAYKSIIDVSITPKQK